MDSDRHVFVCWGYRPFHCQMFLRKIKIKKLVGQRPNKKDISKMIQENRQKWELTLNGFANLLSVRTITFLSLQISQ